MKQGRNFKAAVALGSFTAAMALLTGLPPAQAQTAPGGGSTPGSFLVPGTNTSISFHGLIYMIFDYDLGPHGGSTNYGVSGIPATGPGAPNSGGSSLHGGLSMDVKPVRSIISTSTPTAFGELKTYIEFDFNQTSGTQLLGANADVPRLRQGYGTLGPWLFGQTWSNFADLESWGDPSGGDPTIDAGVPMTTVNGRMPQVRYTWIGGGGLTVAGSIEMPITDWMYTSGSSGITTGASNNIGNPSGGSSSTGIQELPAFVGTINYSQPWGHVALHGMIQQLKIRNSPAWGEGTDISKLGWAIYAAGHLNTWGKDRLGGGIDYFSGASNALPDFSNAPAGSSQGLILSGPNGAACGTSSTTLDSCSVSVASAYGFYANYQHWWTGNLRTNIDAGYEYGNKPSNTAGWSASQLYYLEKRGWSGHLNLIWSPVPGALDITTEWQHFSLEKWSGAKGTDDRLVEQMLFFF